MVPRPFTLLLLAAGAAAAGGRLAPNERTPPPPRPAAGGLVLPHPAALTGLAFSPDGRALATADLNGGLHVWDRAPGKEAWGAASARAHAVTFAPDGRTLATGGPDGLIRVWSAADHTQLRKLATAEDFYALAFAPDGKALAGGGRSGGVRLWDAATGKPVRLFPGQGRVRSVAFSPDGTLLAYGTTGDRAYLFEVASGQPARPLGDAPLAGGCVAFSPDGRILALGGSDRGIGFVDCREVATGGVIRRIRTGADRVNALAFSPDGRALAVGGSRPVVKVWGLATGELLGDFVGHRDEVFCVRFSPDGAALAAGSRDKTAILWPVAGRMQAEKVLPPGPGAGAVNALWADLAAQDAARAYRAVWALRGAPEQAVPFLTARLRSATAFDERQARQWIAGLGSGRYPVRQRAEAELAKLGWVAEPALRQALKDRPPEETRRRLTKLLEKMDAASPPPGTWLRVVRAVAVLEGVGTPAARRTLEAVARGEPQTRLRREAGAALRRLAGQHRR